jgi:hypothetical protein
MQAAFKPRSPSPIKLRSRLALPCGNLQLVFSMQFEAAAVRITTANTVSAANCHKHPPSSVSLSHPFVSAPLACP